MTKNELMEMARECGFQTGRIDIADGSSSYPIIRAVGENCTVSIEKLFNAILERAAVECDKQSDPWNSAGDFIACANAIRSLKITK